MRPTNLNFRNPKEKTAEFMLPVVTNQGRLLFEVSSKQVKPNFPKSKRFPTYDENACKTGYRVGPGAYKQDHYTFGKDHIRGAHIYRNYHRNKDLTNNGYIFVGNQLMFDATFLIPSKKIAAQSISPTIDACEMNPNYSSICQRTSTASNTPSRKNKAYRARHKIMSPNFSDFNSSRASY
ncbi:hypothetical protein SteCoe_11644 [Stentor coeruleus]|uniref:Uncharacterized protein n=1 Tax=Stentor coeruleus TaxID=5963 RepID=A0A1R2CCQ7_9CILI|nr:hypothetical protein SteCoe_11644 [Stentor coeruleus]